MDDEPFTSWHTLHSMYKQFKRLSDVVIATFGLLLLMPVMALISVLVWISLGRPIFFKQTRPGLGARPFHLFKFRTMRDLYDKEGRPLPDVERLSRMGRLLRRMSLDELPQLWNVLRGDMSVIGPRPLFTHYLPFYNERERLRHSVRPGLTGLAQVSGRNRIGWDERLELDARYVEEMSFLMDLNIIFKTIFRVLNPKDVLDEAPQGPLNHYRQDLYPNQPPNKY